MDPEDKKNDEGIKDDEAGKVAPVVPRDEDEETTDFAAVINQQSDMIAKQAKQIDELLAAVSNFTKTGANYQQGKKPDAFQPGEDPRDRIKPFEELDFSI